MKNEPSAQADKMFIQRLDEAALAHFGWLQKVLRCAVLKTSPGDDVLLEDAHCRCAFDGWFRLNYEKLVSIDETATRRLDEQHVLMHDAIRNICRGVLHGVPVSAGIVENFEKSQGSVLNDLAYLKSQFLAHSARLDALTGLPLRYGLEEEFRSCRAQTDRRGELTVVVMLDIDHFKAVNDMHGHSIGDLALHHIATVLSSCCRAGEQLFRYGGEEFVALLQATSREAAMQGVERLLQALRDAPLVLENGHVLQLRASAGLAVPSKSESLADTLSRADHALYAAKTAGRDRLHWSEI